MYITSDCGNTWRQVRWQRGPGAHPVLVSLSSPEVCVCCGPPLPAGVVDVQLPLADVTSRSDRHGWGDGQTALHGHTSYSGRRSKGNEHQGRVEVPPPREAMWGLGGWAEFLLDTEVGQPQGPGREAAGWTAVTEEKERLGKRSFGGPR